MFKKQPKTWKTSSPLRTSDRKKLKQRIISTFGLADSKSTEGEVEAEVPDIFPEGTLTLKFSTHLNEPGVVYLSPNGDPLWFSIGKDKGSGFDFELIPTIYTLWNHPNLLPFLCTPQAVIPILTGGADLMRGGVIHCSPSLDVKEGQLVSICSLSYERVESADTPMLSPPLAVGRMAISSKQLFGDRNGNGDGGPKGKAVLILHTWKDHLWEYGSGAKRDVPTSVPLRTGTDSETVAESNEQKEGITDVQVADGAGDGNGNVNNEGGGDSTELTRMTYTTEQVSQLLRISLIHAIATSSTLNPNPKSSNSQSPSAPATPTIFPIPATTFYTSYILPNRPYYPERIVSPNSASEASDIPTPDPYSITIKSSSHKSLTSFLKFLEKEKPASLISTKPPQKRSAQTDLLITAVNATHPDVQTYPSTPYVTISQIEAKVAKKLTEENELKDSKDPKGGELEVRELWKPHLSSVALFVEGMGGSASNPYTLPEIRSMLNSYIASKQLINPHDQAYINIGDDALLAECIAKKPTKGKKDKAKNQDSEIDAQVEFLKRDELTKKVLDKMQSWYEVKRPGEAEEVITKKGTLSPIQIITKIRQGRKASTLISGFEPFSIGGSLGAEEMTDDLRRICAGATSVSPIPGKPGTQEVLVQGKQSKAVVEYLSGKGVPKKWIEVIGK